MPEGICKSPTEHGPPRLGGPLSGSSPGKADISDNVGPGGKAGEQRAGVVSREVQEPIMVSTYAHWKSLCSVCVDGRF